MEGGRICRDLLTEGFVWGGGPGIWGLEDGGGQNMYGFSNGGIYLRGGEQGPGGGGWRGAECVRI